MCGMSNLWCLPVVLKTPLYRVISVILLNRQAQIYGNALETGMFLVFVRRFRQQN